VIAEAGGCRKEYSRGFLTGWKPRADVHGHRDDNGRAAGHVFPRPASTVQPMRGRSEIDPNPPTECSHHHSVMNGSPTRAAQPPAAPTSPSPIDRRLRIPVQMPSLVFGGIGGSLCLCPKLDSIATSSALQAMLALAPGSVALRETDTILSYTRMRYRTWSRFQSRFSHGY